MQLYRTELKGYGFVYEDSPTVLITATFLPRVCLEFCDHQPCGLETFLPNSSDVSDSEIVLPNSD